MNIQYLGHACFRLEADGYAVVIDPYADGFVPGLAPLRAQASEVLCSHQHEDHNAAGNIHIVPGARPEGFSVAQIDSAHDAQGGAQRGRNAIHVIQAQGLRVAHLGDLGERLDDARVQAIGPLHALMIPVGGFFTIDAAQAAALVERLSPRVVIPMHYTAAGYGFADRVAPVDGFLALRGDVILYDTDTLALAPDTPAQTAVLRYLPRS